MKKKYLYLSLIFLTANQVKSQLTTDSLAITHSGITINSLDSTQTVNLRALCKVWGLLKYYHPSVAKGNVDMDQELFKVMPKIYACKTKEEFNKILYQWILGFGKVETCKKCKEPNGNTVVISPDFKWLTDETIFTTDVIKTLVFIKENPSLGNHYYIEKSKWIGNPEFKNEKGYAKLVNPDAGFRVLCLFRYWNMIQYFFPYKDIIGEDWNTKISEFLPKFLKATDSLSYRLTALELIAQIRDTHANIYNSRTIEKYRGANYSPAQVKFIEDKAVVTGYFNNKLADTSMLQIGDIITKINAKTVEALIKERQPISPASNYPTQLRNIARDLLRSNETALNIEINRNNKLLLIDIPLVKGNRIDLYKDFSGSSDTCFKLITKDVSYFNFGKIKTKYLPDLMKIAMQTKGIIIDLRCYPSEFMVFEMAKYLLPFETPFAKFSSGNIDYPGYFEYNEIVKNGRSNKEYYKGKVIIIINEITQSQAEYTTMALRTAPNAIVIGSTTAGADGNISAISLPGDIRTVISGLGVFYPEGKPTQRIGIIPNIELKPTIKGIKEGRDELIEKAIEVINQ